MSNKDLKQNVLNDLYNLHYRKLKYPKNIDENKPINSIDDIEFDNIQKSRCDIFQNREDVLCITNAILEEGLNNGKAN